MHVFLPLVIAVSHQADQGKIILTETYEESFVMYGAVIGNPSTGKKHYFLFFYVTIELNNR